MVKGGAFLLGSFIKVAVGEIREKCNCGCDRIMAVHLRCMVSIIAWIVNRNRAGARLSPCLTPDVDINRASAFSIPSLILIFDHCDRFIWYSVFF